ncbi:TetR family transcriptional regulator [Streptomyces sp. NBC_01235]|uniref:TetR family transcriptional regulator n=1 Tax=Streptomyces sp. NBC_01235 TaxID=2903788 RepID=UPI002E156AC5|nr:TetR family transcriptional regulator [Streptomyces sp. NBC_01235]
MIDVAWLGVRRRSAGGREEWRRLDAEADRAARRLRRLAQGGSERRLWRPTAMSRAPVCQPYLFGLLPDKKAIFVAAAVRSMEDTRLAFERPTDGVEGSEQALGAMEDAYAQLISALPETLLMQMQGYAVVAAAEAKDDDQTGELVRAGWMRLWETVHLSLGADVHESASFFACGMLGNTLTAIGLPSDCRQTGA